ncbi:hypothetical protein [Acidovorax sp. NCPPB 4044]|uniref:hypothetical protein n=1 Tax=Acidovorax sp. NCPPB 4044 TaxID=2940490 RepID=UPI00230276DE|nr:hypothetical protein [Acidovorax sp. NCPPB 4044]MDA8522184.1 hypothetical protein [Acidovorax sp. NCPPB 4044]
MRLIAAPDVTATGVEKNRAHVAKNIEKSAIKDIANGFNGEDLDRPAVVACVYYAGSHLVLSSTGVAGSKVQLSATGVTAPRPPLKMHVPMLGSGCQSQGGRQLSFEGKVPHAAGYIGKFAMKNVANGRIEGPAESRACRAGNCCTLD